MYLLILSTSVEIWDRHLIYDFARTGAGSPGSWDPYARGRKNLALRTPLTWEERMVMAELSVAEVVRRLVRAGGSSTKPLYV
ncbi:MAG: hypothetical protein GXX95_11640 [Methanomassiliicoccus sp.]|nr:hypothetical protein [Methanomassiliicoccus sp.]